MKSHRYGPLLAALFLMLGVAAAVPTAVSAAPSNTGCVNRNLNSIDKLLDCVNADDALTHLAAFQSFADANGGTLAQVAQKAGKTMMTLTAQTSGGFDDWLVDNLSRIHRDWIRSSGE